MRARGKKMFRSNWLVLLTAALVLGLGAAFANPMTFGGVGKSAVWYWNYVGDGMKQAASDVGGKALFQTPQQGDVTKQISIFQGFIAQGVNGIAFAASNPAPFKHVVQTALKQGIPVVAFDSDAPNSGRLVYVGASAYNGGVVAGKAMIKALGGKGTVAIQVGSLTALNAQRRIQGFMDTIKGTDIKVVTKQNDGEDPSTAFSQAQSILSAHPNLDAFLGVYAYDAAAEAQAVKAAGKVGSVKIVGWDDAPDTLKFIKSGVITATVYDGEKIYGQVATMILYDMNAFGVNNTLRMLGFDPNANPANNIVNVPLTLITADNVAQFMH